MIDVKSAVEIALYQALAGNIAGVTVYQDAPENASLPVTVIGDLTERPIATKGGNDARVTASIATEFAAEERAPLLIAQGRIKDLLHEGEFVVDGWTLRPIFQTANAELAENGETYVGASIFDVLAFAD